MTDVEPQDRRSRVGWALRTLPATTPAGTHDHGQRNGPIIVSLFCIIGLVVMNVGLIFYILARGEARDASELRMRQQIRDSWCQALDGFPQGNVFLDPLREQYGCGPGRPVEDFPPEVQRELNGEPSPVRPSERPSTPDD